MKRLLLVALFAVPLFAASFTASDAFVSVDVTTQAIVYPGVAASGLWVKVTPTPALDALSPESFSVTITYRELGGVLRIKTVSATFPSGPGTSQPAWAFAWTVGEATVFSVSVKPELLEHIFTF
jgi:hypothetical protein